MASTYQQSALLPLSETAVSGVPDGHAPMLAVNPATVPQRSPFRYPGGKTWLVPLVRLWLKDPASRIRRLVEPFAGGAIVGLTAAFEGLTSEVTLVELDPDVSAVWKAILEGDGVALAQRYASFRPVLEEVQATLATPPLDIEDRAFHTLLRNRTSRGGIMAPGAGLIRKGENGKGLGSRWYPHTIQKRILDIVALRDRIRFIEGDGLSVMKEYSAAPEVVWFIDPPYTVAGRRLYSYSTIDHRELFRVARNLSGDFLMTYDKSSEIETLAAENGFEVRRVTMKTTHHDRKDELVIARSFDWLGL